MPRTQKQIHIAYGELEVAGESIALYHARAAYTDHGGLRVVVSDLPVSSSQPAALLEAAASGATHAIQFDIAPDHRSAAITTWSNRVPLHTTVRSLDARAIQPLANGIIAGNLPAFEYTIGGIPFRYRVQFAAEIDSLTSAKAA